MDDIRQDDLSHGGVRALLAFHLMNMHTNSPPGSVFALDTAALSASDITVWTIWRDDNLAGIGALKSLTNGNGEIKSMRTHRDYLRQGVAATLLAYIIAQARERNMARLSLETGSGPAFAPALALYRAHGFVDGDAFADYERSAFNQFLHLTL